MLKKISSMTILSALLLILAGCIIDPPPPPPPSKLYYKSQIEGYVSDINGPVAGAKITIAIPTKSRMSEAKRPNVFYETTTDSNGRFKAEYMAVATFSLTAAKAGYDTVTVTDIVTVKDKTTIQNIILTKAPTPPK